MTTASHRRPPTGLPLHAVALVSASLLTPTADAQITLDGTFDHGSLLSWSVINETSTAPTVNLGGRDNFYGGGRWRWLYFEATGVEGLTPRFSIDENFAGGRRSARHRRDGLLV